MVVEMYFLSSGSFKGVTFVTFILKHMFLLLSIMRKENFALEEFSLPSLWTASCMCSLSSHTQM